MPRPGPRPYECVRRAWHSDRHQPMRGSLIQEIFRVANEAHSAATRKNREWQEKLPFVVFKAEEIMYSKANSEAEYMDLSTLWDRANDAIDTIIRKDDSSSSSSPPVANEAHSAATRKNREWQEKLPFVVFKAEEIMYSKACIEAALNLGCIPRRASRSQRHSNPGCYLSSTAKYSAPISLKIPDGSKVHPGMGMGMGSSSALHLQSSSPDSTNLASSASWYSPVLRSAAPNSAPPCSLSSVFNASSEPTTSRAVISYGSPPLSSNPSVDPYKDGPAIPVETGNLPEFGRMYPLCYFGSSNENSCFRVPPLQTPSDHKQQNMGAAAGKTFKGKSTTSSSNNAPIDVETFAPDGGCDLSLRLGLPSPTWSGAESSWTDEVEDVGSSSSCDDSSKFYDPSPCRARAVNIERSITPAEDKCFEFF
ncbi:uncharacterized protein LOC109722554 [Ananas comosus]|uniref:Uncharacterized protein LOC109722554 n=1 Tax=Ananas comosus TaxID=4615 RepID=A0A6P5GLP4_ANACO|nr:uncharacterized protein LOC109722554 [Ananas comosus]